jgi:hypothetical protein
MRVGVRGPCRESELVETPPHPDLLPASGEKEHKRRGLYLIALLHEGGARLFDPELGEFLGDVGADRGCGREVPLGAGLIAAFALGEAAAIERGRGPRVEP